MTDPLTVYAGLEPRELWRHFAALNAIPRPSGEEAAARDYVRRTATAAGARWEGDAAGNTVIYVPATPGREQAPATLIQAHLDMVSEKRPEVTHDFSRDPIRPRVVEGWVYASGTTLGADNGIGAACTLALLTQPGLAHGPLELLFTVEEETGLGGATDLDPSLISARSMINLDSEDPRELTIGCAGGAGAALEVDLETEAPPAGWIGQEIRISGLKGGHSGVQIHEPLANAIKLLTGALLALRTAGIPYRLCRLDGGNARNAIPRDAAAIAVLPAASIDALQQVLARYRQELWETWSADEPNLALQVTGAPVAPAVSLSTTEQITGILEKLPHGVLAMSDQFPGKVETSANLATVRTEPGSAGKGKWVIVSSVRGFVQAELGKLLAQITSLAHEAGARAILHEGYPGWEPDPHSRLLLTAETVYNELFGRAPEVQVIHAGLECGIIAAKAPGMEAVSFGPRIEGAHTPEERVLISSVDGTWQLLLRLLDALSRSPAEAQS